MNGGQGIARRCAVAAANQDSTPAAFRRLTTALSAVQPYTRQPQDTTRPSRRTPILTLDLAVKAKRKLGRARTPRATRYACRFMSGPPGAGTSECVERQKASVGAFACAPPSVCACACVRVLAHAMVTRVGGSALWARTPLKAACLNEARSLVDQPEPSPWQFVAPDERIHAIIVCG